MSKTKALPPPQGQQKKAKPVPHTVYAPKSTTMENHDTTVNVHPSNTQVVTFNIPKFTALQLGLAAMFISAGATIGVIGGLSAPKAAADFIAWLFA